MLVIIARPFFSVSLFPLVVPVLTLIIPDHVLCTMQISLNYLPLSIFEKSLLWARLRFGFDSDINKCSCLAEKVVLRKWKNGPACTHAQAGTHVHMHVHEQPHMHAHAHTHTPSPPHTDTHTQKHRQRLTRTHTHYFDKF